MKKKIAQYYVILNKIENSAFLYLIHALVAMSFLFFTFVTFRYVHQPLVDVHAFRQTQTALSAYWLLKEGWSLAYQTPIAGFPWAIPFEFPIYQALVASISLITGFELEAVGRSVSYAFLVACAWPSFILSARLNLPKCVPLVFCALLWTSPLCVYWGRTFMIETAALFFSFASLPYAIDLIKSVGGWRSFFLFTFFSTAAVLQKSTTGGPILLFIFMVALFTRFRLAKITVSNVCKIMYPLIVICIPLIIGFAWAHYADVVKNENLFGSQLTSQVLVKWNFGTMAQRLDPKTWSLVVWERSFGWNACGILGLVILVLPWFGGRGNSRFAWLSLSAIALYLLPILIFTNLHVVHEYYQVANVPFLLGALSIVIGGWFRKVTGSIILVSILTMVVIFSNLAVFSKSYGIVITRSLDEQDKRSVQAYKVGQYLRENTPLGTGLVVFGQDYSSEIAFQSQRKTITVPPWFKEYRQLWDNPQKYLGDADLSAIVVCPLSDNFPDDNDITTRVKNSLEWRMVSVDGCRILFHDRK